jgi:hypothetical protein
MNKHISGFLHLVHGSQGKGRILMNNLVIKLMSREGRKYIYIVSLAAIPLLVFYGVISEDAAPLWIALAGAVIAPVMALSHLSPEDPKE